MNTIYFYIYLVVVGISILLFTFLRCQYDYRLFDPLLYPNENFNILANYTFLTYHCLTYAALGYLFGFEVFYSMILKIVFFETYLFFIEYCDIFQTSPRSHLIITLIFSLVSYIFGCLISSVASKIM